MPTIAPEDSVRKTGSGTQILAGNTVAGSRICSAFGLDLVPTSYPHPAISDLEWSDEDLAGSTGFTSAPQQGGSVSVGVSSESDLLVNEVDSWIHELERSLSTPAQQLLRWAHRDDVLYELDIDLPSMRRQVGRREIHIVARTRRVPKIGFLVEDLDVDPEAPGDD